MLKRIKKFWLKRQWRRRQSEALPFLLLILALIDGALLAEFLAIFRDFLEKNYASAATKYKVVESILTLFFLVLTWVCCRDWIKPMDRIDKELKKHK